MRGESLYVDQQSGMMFWLDLAARSFWNGEPWSRPSPTGYVNPTGASVPVLPDVLDALACSGFSRAAIDAVTRPGDPYAGDRPGGPKVTVTFSVFSGADSRQRCRYG